MKWGNKWERVGNGGKEEENSWIDHGFFRLVYVSLSQKKAPRSAGRFFYLSFYVRLCVGVP